MTDKSDREENWGDTTPDSSEEPTTKPASEVNPSTYVLSQEDFKAALQGPSVPVTDTKRICREALEERKREEGAAVELSEKPTTKPASEVTPSTYVLSQDEFKAVLKDPPSKEKSSAQPVIPTTPSALDLTGEKYRAEMRGREEAAANEEKLNSSPPAKKKPSEEENPIKFGFRGRAFELWVADRLLRGGFVVMRFLMGGKPDPARQMANGDEGEIDEEVENQIRSEASKQSRGLVSAMLWGGVLMAFATLVLSFAMLRPVTFEFKMHGGNGNAKFFANMHYNVQWTWMVALIGCVVGVTAGGMVGANRLRSEEVVKKLNGQRESGYREVINKSFYKAGLESMGMLMIWGFVLGAVILFFSFIAKYPQLDKAVIDFFFSLIFFIVWIPSTVLTLIGAVAMVVVAYLTISLQLKMYLSTYLEDISKTTPK